MRILAIDPGLKCGWALFEGDPKVLDISFLNFGTWNLSGNRFEGAGFRWIRFKNYLREISKIEPIDLIFYEEVRRHLGTDAAHIYGAITGQIQAFCEEQKIPYKGIPSGTWKKSTIGKGNAKKEMIFQYASQRWHDVKNFDEADALCILEHALNHEV